MAYNKTRLFFTLIGDDDTIRDQIPLHEIKTIEIMPESTEIRQNDDERHHSISSVDKNQFNLSRASSKNDNAYPKIIRIETIPDGYNSGRDYYFKPDSTECCESIVEELRRYASAAKGRNTGISSLQKLQTTALSIYDSIPFQIVSALLIIAVYIFLFFCNLDLSRQT